MVPSSPKVRGGGKNDIEGLAIKSALCLSSGRRRGNAERSHYGDSPLSGVTFAGAEPSSSPTARGG